MRALFQTQLSNYNTKGQFDLACDSGWQMCTGRARELLKLDPELDIVFLGPELEQLIDTPITVNPDLFNSDRVDYVETYIMPNAAATRYDFDLERVAASLNLYAHKANKRLRYDWVYINDPCLLKHYRAMFFLIAGYMPKFICHSHFVDCLNNPKFPTEISLWLGQCEAAIKADFNFWQCEAALREFADEMRNTFKPEFLERVLDKSEPWDDGFSIEEMNLPINFSNIRFDTKGFVDLIANKRVIFVPNRIGGEGRSSDYTQCGRFMFDVLPKLWERRTAGGTKPCDFVVIAGNPNQKFSNQELTERCGKYGYVSLVDGTFNRDEYRWIASLLGTTGELALGWYTQDTFGGTASRELIEQGMMPAWVDMFEYSSIAEEVAKKYPPVLELLCRSDFSDAVDVLMKLLNYDPRHIFKFAEEYRRIVRERSSFEVTTRRAYEIIQRICRES